MDFTKEPNFSKRLFLKYYFLDEKLIKIQLVNSKTTEIMMRNERKNWVFFADANFITCQVPKLILEMDDFLPLFSPLIQERNL